MLLISLSELSTNACKITQFYLHLLLSKCENVVRRKPKGLSKLSVWTSLEHHRNDDVYLQKQINLYKPTSCFVTIKQNNLFLFLFYFLIVNIHHLHNRVARLYDTRHLPNKAASCLIPTAGVETILFCVFLSFVLVLLLAEGPFRCME